MQNVFYSYYFLTIYHNIWIFTPGNGIFTPENATFIPKG